MTEEEQQICEAFMREFKELLRRYNAEFSVTEESQGYYFSKAVAEIDFNGVYNADGNMLRPYINFTLPGVVIAD